MPKIYLTDQAEKDLGKLPQKEINKITRGFSYLEKDEQAGKKLTGKLRDLYSLKAWPYRIVYWINKKHEVWILHILHRKEVYQKI